MSAQPHVELVGARASSAVSCTRRATYQGLGAEPEPATEEMQRYWRRGHAVSNAIRSEIVNELRQEGRRPRAEEEIPWPAIDPVGTGHADLYVPHEKHIIEITSTAGAALEARKALQAAFYTVHHPRAERASVLAIDPSTFESRWYPIAVESLEPRVWEITASVVEALRTNELPERACRHPHDGPARWCEHAEKCFESWVRPDADLLLLDEEARVLAELTDDVATAKQALAQAESARDMVRDELRPYLEPGVDVETDSIAKLKVITIAGRRSLSLGDLETAGHQLPAELEAFVKQSEPHDRWQIKRRETP